MKNYIKLTLIASLVLSIGVSSCKNEAKEETKTPIKKEVVKVTTEKKPVVAKKIEPVVEKAANKYFLILASFQDLKNANRLQKKLTKKGYASEVHYAANGFHRVSYKAFSDRKLAFKELKSARAIAENKENWLYIKQ